MTQDDENLREQVRLIWRAKWLLAAVTLLFGGAALALAFILPKQYEASVVLAPVNMSAGGGSLGSLGSMASQFGGIAALAGISIGGDSSKAESIAVLQSEYLTESYIQQNGMMQVLYSKDWDPVRKAWRRTDEQHLPTLWKANRKFDRQIRKVTPNAKTGLVTMVITWTDAKLAATWANGMVQMANDFLRSKAIRESERNISYLNEEATKSNVVEVKQAIYAVMKTEINRQMIARGSAEYAFRIIDPATASELASSPNKLIYLAAGMALGLLAALAWIFGRAGLAS